MHDELNDLTPETVGLAGNPVVAAAMAKLESLDEVPIQAHAAVFEDVRSDLRSALDAD